LWLVTGAALVGVVGIAAVVGVVALLVWLVPSTPEPTTAGKSSPIRQTPRDSSSAKAKSGDGKKDDQPKKPPPSEPSGERLAGAVYPRRALLIGVCSYCAMSPLLFGDEADDDYLGSSLSALADQFETALDFPQNQIAVLSDGADNSAPAKKATIEGSVKYFLESARSQDCIVLLFTGHVLEIDKEAYLVPIDGYRNDARTLIALGWLYDQLARCKAHQKVLVLDLGHGEPVGEVLFDRLKHPPKEVRVWTSCLAGEKALDVGEGSVFLEAMCHSCKDLLTRPEEPIPVKAMAQKTDKYLQEKVKAAKHKQTTALLGAERADWVPYKAGDKLPPAVAIKAPAVSAAQVAELKAIVEELDKIPQATSVKLPPLNPDFLDWPAALMEEYQRDYKDFLEFKGRKEETYALRTAVAEAIVALQKNAGMKIRSLLPGVKGKELDILKKEIQSEQKGVGEQLLSLKEALNQLDDVRDRRKKESKRWQVLFDWVDLRLKSRIVYLVEYDYILGTFRGDAFVLEPGDKLFQLSPKDKLSNNEPRYKDYAKDVKKGWDKIPKDFPGTPWAMQAQRESAISLGLTWKSSK
jgi:hypothetical protein